jgi:hypothetical protein
LGEVLHQCRHVNDVGHGVLGWVGLRGSRWLKLTRNFNFIDRIPGVLKKAIKSCKIQLDRDAALGVQGVSKNPIVHFIIQFPH